MKTLEIDMSAKTTGDDGRITSHVPNTMDGIPDPFPGQRISDIIGDDHMDEEIMKTIEPKEASLSRDERTVVALEEFGRSYFSHSEKLRKTGFSRRVWSANGSKAGPVACQATEQIGSSAS